MVDQDFHSMGGRLILLFAGVGAMVCAAGCAPTERTVAIAVSAPEIDLGQFDTAVTREHTFSVPFTIQADRAVKLRKIGITCGCVQLVSGDLLGKWLQPGESYQAQFRYDLSDRVGKDQVRITFLTESQRYFPAEAQVQALVVHPPVSSPARLQFSLASDGSGARQMVTISRMRGMNDRALALDVEGSELASLPLVSATPLEKEIRGNRVIDRLELVLGCDPPSTQQPAAQDDRSGEIVLRWLDNPYVTRIAFQIRGRQEGHQAP